MANYYATTRSNYFRVRDATAFQAWCLKRFLNFWKSEDKPDCCALLGKLLPQNAPEYADHNNPVDRVNEVWRAILQMRDFTPPGKYARTL